jgi:hypothetical protein
MGSRFIEALVDQNPFLEAFKMKHRELTSSKCRKGCPRRDWRYCSLGGCSTPTREDPDIWKTIVIVGSGASPNIDMDNP